METKLRKGCALILECGNKILLLRRSKDKKFEPNKWNLPGGHVESNELSIDGARRELNEEAGIVLPDGAKIMPLGSKIIESETPFEIHYFVFYCKLNKTMPIVKINNESSEFGWFTRKQIKKIDLARGEDTSFAMLTAYENSNSR